MGHVRYTDGFHYFGHSHFLYRAITQKKRAINSHCMDMRTGTPSKLVSPSLMALNCLATRDAVSGSGLCGISSCSSITRRRGHIPECIYCHFGCLIGQDSTNQDGFELMRRVKPKANRSEDAIMKGGRVI